MASKSLWRSLQARVPLKIESREVYRYFLCSARHASQQQPNDRSSERTTHFGFETVPESTKQAKVAGVFTSVATSYDIMNDLMSLGIHRFWKDHFVRSLNPGSLHGARPQRILDVAGGTGDIAYRLLDHATDINRDRETSVVVADINPDMLSEGRKRASSSRYGAGERLAFIEANAEDLKSAGIEDNTIDLYTVAFGIRNFTSPMPSLHEAYRVLKPGGVFACLEFSKVSSPLPFLNTLYKTWSFGVIPMLGQLVAGDRESYRYLVESIERFPDQRTFGDMVKGAGFVVPGSGEGWEDLSGGIVAIHKGIKPLK